MDITVHLAVYLIILWQKGHDRYLGHNNYQFDTSRRTAAKMARVKTLQWLGKFSRKTIDREKLMVKRQITYFWIQLPA